MGGHSTRMLCPTHSHIVEGVWSVLHKDAMSYSGHYVLPMALLTIETDFGRTEFGQTEFGQTDLIKPTLAQIKVLDVYLDLPELPFSFSNHVKCLDFYPIVFLGFFFFFFSRRGRPGAHIPKGPNGGGPKGATCFGKFLLWPAFRAILANFYFGQCPQKCSVFCSVGQFYFGHFNCTDHCNYNHKFLSEGWGSEGEESRRVGSPKFRAFSPPSLGVFSWNFGWALKCARLEFSGCREPSCFVFASDEVVVFLRVILLHFRQPSRGMPWMEHDASSRGLGPGDSRPPSEVGRGL